MKHERGRGLLTRLRRKALLCSGVAGFLTSSASAQDVSVRLGNDIVLKPFLLYDLDQGSLRQSAPGGQAGGFNLRRAWTGVTVSISDQLKAGLIWDFGAAPGGPQRLYEAQVTYTGIKPLAFTAGVFKPSFGLESTQGAADILFLERADIVTVTRGIAAGIERQAVEARARGDRFHAALSLTAGTSGPGRDGDQRAVVARFVGLPIRTDGMTFHLGLSGEYVFRPARAAGALPAYAFSAQQELRIDQVAAPLATKSIQARDVGSIGPEIGFASGRLWLQSEWYAVLLDRRFENGGGTARFNGWYAQASYTFTGHPREWKPDLGAWGAPEPTSFNPRAGEFGSFEAGARYSALNLNSLGVDGGREGIWSAVLNWRPAKPLRFSLQYEHANVVGGPLPRHFDAVAGRAQLQF